MKQFKQILITTSLLLWVVTAISQVKHKAVLKKPAAKRPESSQLKEFKHLAANANVVFVFPPGLKEIPALNNEDFSFDYAMELPGREFEVWFQVKSQKADWLNYERLKNDPKQEIANPDSTYSETGSAHAKAFTDEGTYVTRGIPPDILARYNADAGRTFLLNLRDLPEAKHYKYALLITLQKYHTGTIVAICFANEKGAEFFKNINKVSKCLKFKPGI
ncbi:MAG TPA: hypothetical protein VK668_19815 [Mucilaginibacter sp.]|nr:hypothetical protein [Mucilaginibacter sp.]